jgi:D-3-phosphoglycerate dehydrogenase
VAPFQVVITDFDGGPEDVEAQVLRDSGLDVELARHDWKQSALLIPHVRDADAVIVQFADIDRSVIAAMPRCRVISRYGVGLDMIDIAAATERGIRVANVPDFCIDEVSTQTLGFVIDLDRRTHELVEHVRAGRWGSRPLPVLAPARLRGQTLGIVGLGAIGLAVAAKAVVFGLRLLAYDPYVAPHRVPDFVQMVALPELLRRSDYVSLHCPLAPETRGLIGAAELAAMKPTAYLVNMARGPVVDQVALRAALERRTIAGAALDVLEREPPDASEPLLRLDNVLITPHSASWSAESLLEMRQGAARNVVIALQGGMPPSAVNRAALKDRRLAR